MEGPLESSEAVQRATALIEQRLAQEEESEVGTGVWRPEQSLGTPISSVMGRESLALVPAVVGWGGQVSPLAPGSSWQRGLLVRTD